MVEPLLTYYCDGLRHLVCVPYSRINLHLMAADLGIGRHWFHRDHYDIPKRMLQEVVPKCKSVRPRDILSIINGTYECGELE